MAAKKESRFYIYKCVVDDGGAPCVECGLLSLCICKPAIRGTAQPGDVIFAFGSNFERPANRLVYIAKVTRALPDGEYYELEEFQNRGDCIYQRRSGRFRIRASAKFHGTHKALARDLGKWPDYDRANCLVSSDFRYFGDKGTDEWKAGSPELKLLVESLGQGHRVKHRPTLRDELSKLRKRTWKAYRRKVLGKPLHGVGFEPNGDEDQDVIKVCRRRCYYVRKKC